MRELAPASPEEQAEMEAYFAAQQGGQPPQQQQPQPNPAPQELGTRPEVTAEPGHDLQRQLAAEQPPEPMSLARTVRQTNKREPAERPNNELPVATRDNSTPAEHKRNKGENTDESWYEDAPAVLAAIADGIMWGGFDEAASALMAGMGAIAGQGEYAELYDQYFDPAQAKRDQWADEHPVADFASNLVGGILTGGPAVALGKSVAKAAGKSTIKQIAGGGAVLAGEGAVSGALSAKPGERGEGAAWGAAAAPIFGGAFHAAGAGINKLRSRSSKIAPIIDEAGNVTPMNVAAPTNSVRQSMYQWLIGTAWGGKGPMRAQNDAYLKQFKDSLSRADGEVLAASAANAVAKSDADLAAKEAAERATAAVKRRTRMERARTARNKDEVTRLVDEDKVYLAAKQTKEIKEELDHVNTGFRDAATVRSMSASMSKEVRDGVANGTPQQKRFVLDNWWKTEGFGLVRGRKSNIDTNKFLSDISKALNNVAHLNGDARQEAFDMAKPFLAALASGKPVTGEAFLAARNRLAVLANAIPYSQTASQNATKNALRSLTDVMDDHFGKGITAQRGDFAKRWAAEKEAYRNYQIGRDASSSAAVVNPSVQGAFGPNDWIQAANSAGYAGARGELPLQTLANQTAKKADELGEELALKSKLLMTNLKSGATNELRRLDEELAERIAALSDAGMLEKHVNRRTKVRVARETEHEASRSLAELQARSEGIKRAIAEIEAKGPMKATSWFSQHAAANMLWRVFLGGVSVAGAVTGAVTSPVLTAGGLAGGVTLGKMFSNPKVQQALALQMELSPGTIKTLIDIGNRNAQLAMESGVRAGIIKENTGEDFPAY